MFSNAFRFLKFCILLAAVSLACSRPAAADVRPIVGQESIHIVAAGEELDDIAHGYGMALEHIAFANGLEVTNEVQDLAPGTRLLIPGRHVLPADPPRDGMVLNLPERGIFFFRDGHFVKFYPVAIGRLGFLTPRGSFYVIEKIKNPTWSPPKWAKLGETPWPPGPKNPLGDRWIGLSAHGVGIHGTTCPSAIGMAASHGCIRMYPDLERELFDEVSIGMPVRIEYEPVKLGRDPQTGQILMAVYPDVYHLMDLEEAATQAVRAARLENRVSSARVQELVSLEDGRPRLLTGSEISIRLPDREVPMVSPPLLLDGKLWVRPDVAAAFGLQLQGSPGNQEVSGRGRTLPLDQPVRADSSSAPAAASAPEAPLVRQHGGETLVSAPGLLDFFQIPYQWDAVSRTLHVTLPSEQQGLQQ